MLQDCIKPACNLYHTFSTCAATVLLLFCYCAVTVKLGLYRSIYRDLTEHKKNANRTDTVNTPHGRSLDNLVNANERRYPAKAAMGGSLAGKICESQGQNAWHQPLYFVSLEVLKAQRRMDEMNDDIAKFFGVSGTVGNRTYVKGRKRRYHSRRRRGTVKKAVVNHKLASISALTSQLNAVASSVHRVINLRFGDIREGDLWTKMQKRMRACPEPEEVSLLTSFKGLDLHSRYPLHGLLPYGPKLTITPEDEQMVVRLDIGTEPPHVKAKITACRYGLVAIYPFLDTGIVNKKNEPVSHHEIIYSDWMSKEESIPSMRFSFERPQQAQYCVLLLVMETMEGNTPVLSPSGRRGGVVGVVEM